MGTAAVEGKPDEAAMARDALGFRNRGQTTTRLEAFVDAAFAFALSLVVIASGEIPRNADELLQATKSIPAFAACFWLIATFWRGHVDWSQRFGLDDSGSRQLSLLLVFMVLVFVYPLQIVFSSFFGFATGNFLTGKFAFRGLEDVRLMFMTFAVAFGSMGAVIWTLYRRAARSADALALDPRERAGLRIELWRWGLVPIFAALSFALCFVDAGLVYGAPGMLFFGLHVAQAIARRGLREPAMQALPE